MVLFLLWTGDWNRAPLLFQWNISDEAWEWRYPLWSASLSWPDWDVDLALKRISRWIPGIRQNWTNTVSCILQWTTINLHGGYRSMVPTNMSVTETITLDDQAAVNWGKAFYFFTDDHNDTHHQSKDFFSYCVPVMCADFYIHVLFSSTIIG